MLQTDLFGDVRADEAITIPGLHYCSGYIDETEQRAYSTLSTSNLG